MYPRTECDDVQAICKKVTLYLKQFFLISFERGGLTPQVRSFWLYFGLVTW